MQVLNVHYRRQIEDALSKRFAHAHAAQFLSERDLRVAWGPSVERCRYRPGRPLVVRALFEVFPPFELGDYTDLEVRVEPDEVTDEHVEAVLEQYRLRHASFRNLDPRPIERGDEVVCTIRVSEANDDGDGPEDDDGEREAPQETPDTARYLVVGDPELSTPQIDALLEGMEPGQTAVVRTSNAEDFGMPGLGGRRCSAEIAVQRLVEKELPDLDDEFAQDLDGGHETLDEVRDAIRKELSAQVSERAEAASRELVHYKLASSHPEAHNLPGRFLQQRLREVHTKFVRKWREEYGKPPSDRMIQSRMMLVPGQVVVEQVLDRIADVEDISVPNQEVQQHLDQWIAEYCAQEGASTEDATDAALRMNLAGQIRAGMRRTRAIEFVIANGQLAAETAVGDGEEAGVDQRSSEGAAEPSLTAADEAAGPSATGAREG